MYLRKHGFKAHSSSASHPVVPLLLFWRNNANKDENATINDGPADELRFEQSCGVVQDRFLDPSGQDDASWDRANEAMQHLPANARPPPYFCN